MLTFDLLPLFSVKLQFFDPPAFLNNFAKKFCYHWRENSVLHLFYSFLACETTYLTPRKISTLVNDLGKETSYKKL